MECKIIRVNRLNSFLVTVVDSTKLLTKAIDEVSDSTVKYALRGVRMLSAIVYVEFRADVDAAESRQKEGSEAVECKVIAVRDVETTVSQVNICAALLSMVIENGGRVVPVDQLCKSKELLERARDYFQNCVESTEDYPENGERKRSEIYKAASETAALALLEAMDNKKEGEE